MKTTQSPAEVGNTFVGGPRSSNIPEKLPVTFDPQNDVFGPPPDQASYDNVIEGIKEAHRKGNYHPVLNTRMPKLGEIVIFFPNPDDSVARSNGRTHCPAIITNPWSSVCANIKIIPDHGPMQDRGSVSHRSANPAGYHFVFLDEYHGPDLDRVI